MGDGNMAGKIAEILGLLAVLSLLIEVALSVLFNWRGWIVFFEGRGLKAVVNFAVCLVVVINGDIKGVNAVIAAWPGGGDPFPHYLDIVLTALLLAGGSNTLNQLFQAFGLRDPIKAVDRKKLMVDRATFSLEVDRSLGDGGAPLVADQVQLLVNGRARTTMAFAGDAGTLTFPSGLMQRFRGYTIVQPGPATIQVWGQTPDGKDVYDETTVNFAPRGVVTLRMRLDPTAEDSEHRPAERATPPAASDRPTRSTQ